MEKWLVNVFIVFCLTLAFQGVAFADQYYNIKNYDVKIDVAEDNTYAIRETIDVYFNQARHGIYRDIPIRNYGYSHKIEGLRVYDPLTRQSIPFEGSQSGSEISLKIGNPNEYVAGDQTYRIEYTYDGGDDRILDYDEFYFNLIGNGWDSTIDSVTFRVTMPKSFDSSKLNVTVGRAGSTDNSRASWEVNGNVITGEALGLSPFEGLTVALNLPQGYYDDVSEPYSMIWIILLFGFLVLALIGAILVRNGNFKSSQIVPVLSFYPPDSLNPAEMAYVFGEEQLTNENVASLIVYWASKGYLRIVEDEKPGLFGNKEEVYFERLVEASQLPSGYEKILFVELFAYGYGDTVHIDDLKEKFYEDLNVTREFIRDQYRDDREILENKTQYGAGVIAFLIMVVSTFLLAPYVQVILGIPFLGALIPTAIILLILWLIPYAIASRRPGRRGAKKGVKIVRYLFTGIFLSQFFIVSRVIFRDIQWSEISFSSLMLYPLIALILYIAVMYSIGKVKRYTPFAQDLLNRIHGFKNFLETAKLDKLHMLFEENPEYFYDMLPYVMIFGSTEIWDEYMRMIAVTGPDWYVSNRPFRAYYMMNTVNHSFARMSAAPQQSCSGGGSVGGGGGGGGGGSW